MFNWFIIFFISLWTSSFTLTVLPTQFYQVPIQKSVSSSVEFVAKPIWSKALVLKDNHQAWPLVTAQAAAVVDWQSGQILWQKNPHQPLVLASLTKLMTALVVLENYWQPDKNITISSSSLSNIGRSYLLTGEKYLVKDIFKIMLMASANEAAESLAANFDRRQFVNLMNERGNTLNLFDFKFVGPSGLEKENLATLSDVIKIAQVVFSKPEVLNVTVIKNGQIKSLAGKVIEFENTNELLKTNLQVIAGKTGTLDEAGFSVVSVVQKTGQRPLLVVVLGAVNHFARFEEAEKLANWAWSNYH